MYWSQVRILPGPPNWRRSTITIRTFLNITLWNYPNINPHKKIQNYILWVREWVLDIPFNLCGRAHLTWKRFRPWTHSASNDSIKLEWLASCFALGFAGFFNRGTSWILDYVWEKRVMSLYVIRSLNSLTFSLCFSYS